MRIKNGTIGLVYYKGELTDVLKAGLHFINPFVEEVRVYCEHGQFNTGFDLTLLMQNQKFASVATLIEVKENEVCLVHKGSLFHKLLTSGRYIFLNPYNEYTFENLDVSSSSRILDKRILRYANSYLVSYIRKLEVDSFQEAILTINGEFRSVLKSGVYYFYKNDTKVAIKVIDLRSQLMDIAGQEMLTKDKAQLRVNFNLEYKVSDAVTAVLENKNYEQQLYVAAQLLLREIVGTNTLDGLLENKQAITKYVLENIGKTTKQLGLEVTNAGVKDVILTGEMKQIMNQVIVAQKKAQANVITRREETASTRSLLNTAKLLEENQMLYKLKEMEYLERIADKVGEITVAGGTDVLKQLKQIF